MLTRQHVANLPTLLIGAIFASSGHAAELQVTTPSDEFAAGSACSIREAIQSANTNGDFGGCTHTGSYGADTITLPAGFYSLSRVGSEDDNNVSGDLDIRSNLTIQGAGAGSTSIANCASCNDRVVQVVIGASVVINDVTLRDGNLIGGRSGAGLRSEPNTSTTLNRVTVGLNTVHANAGGILNRGNMTLNSCAVTNNVTIDATEGGGGIFNDDNAELTLNNTRILANETTGRDVNGNGGGIYNDENALLIVYETTVSGNIAGPRSLGRSVLGSGGGIFSLGRFEIRQSTIDRNIARGSDAEGGGIFSAGDDSLIERSLIKANRAEENDDVFGTDCPSGGGIGQVGSLIIRDSVIDANVSECNGGGVDGHGSSLLIQRTTISNNKAVLPGPFGGNGGGLSVGSDAILENSTIVANSADGAGGGASMSASIVLSSTFASNTSNSDDFGMDSGGAIHVGQLPPQIGNTVIAGNKNGRGESDQCDGVLISLGYNLVQDKNFECNLINGVGDRGGVAQLAPLTDNGGAPVGASNATVSVALLTRAPTIESPLLDNGDPAGCSDNEGAVLATDQRGFARAVDGGGPDPTARCDIGAVELSILPDSIFRDSFE